MVVSTALFAATANAAPLAPSPPPIALGLSYAAYVHGFRALLLTIQVSLSGDRYAVNLEDHTVGIVGALINNHVQSSAEGLFRDGRVIPSSYTSRGHSRGADRATSIVYVGATPTVRVLTPVEPNRDKVPPGATIGAIDPLSLIASLFGRIASGANCDDSSLVFDGARLSTVRSWAIGPTTIPTTTRSPYAGAATECDFRDQEIAGFLHDGDYDRAHRPGGGQAFLASVRAGGPIIPLRARFSTVEHGDIDLYLIGVTEGPVRSGAS